MTTGTSTVLVSLETLDIGSAQGTYSYYNSTISGWWYHAQYFRLWSDSMFDTQIQISFICLCSQLTVFAYCYIFVLLITLNSWNGFHGKKRWVHIWGCSTSSVCWDYNHRWWPNGTEGVISCDTEHYTDKSNCLAEPSVCLCNHHRWWLWVKNCSRGTWAAYDGKETSNYVEHVLLNSFGYWQSLDQQFHTEATFAGCYSIDMCRMVSLEAFGACANKLR